MLYIKFNTESDVKDQNKRDKTPKQLELFGGVVLALRMRISHCILVLHNKNFKNGVLT